MDKQKIKLKEVEKVKLKLVDLMCDFTQLPRKLNEVNGLIGNQKRNLAELEARAAVLKNDMDMLDRILIMLPRAERALMEARMRNKSERKDLVARRLGMTKQDYDRLWRSGLRKMMLALDQELRLHEEDAP